MESIWAKNGSRQNFETLSGDKKVDVLIIGGGIAGILCLYMLKNKGVDCALVECDKICSGITKSTTAKITLQHGLIYSDIEKRYGIEKAEMYASVQSRALEKFKGLAKNHPCDFEDRASYVYSLKDREKLEREVEVMRRLHLGAELQENLNLPFPTVGAVMLSGQAQFHPLKFLYSISQELPIYENTKVLRLTKNGALTNRGNITAEKIIVATHFPIFNKHGSYFLKMYQHRSYVLALKDAPLVEGMYVDENEKGMSFRDYDGKLLIGGGSHRTGKQGGGFEELECFAKKHYTGSKIVGRWATQDCMTLDGIPYIGRYSNNTPQLFVATGFNKWGMTSAMAGAMILSDMVMGIENSCASIFSPSRSVFYPQLIINWIESIKGLITPFAPRCPHLGCALKYNKQEHTWDCPCHGSRFSESGELIDNPAIDDLKGVYKGKKKN